jgi:hypothetical protein
MALDPTTLITVLAVAMFGIGVVLYLLPVGTYLQSGCHLAGSCMQRPSDGPATTIWTTPGRHRAPAEGATVNEPDIAERSVADAIDEPSMRVFEYAICALAGIAALLLGLIR